MAGAGPAPDPGAMDDTDLFPPAPPAAPPAAGRAADASRVGAVWVTATGAFLLLVAAAVFVAVQWDHIPDALKLAALGLLSGGCLLAGRVLRRSLPATAGVLYHLGAFLIPVVSTAIAVHAGAGWAAMVLVEGVVATMAFWVLDRVEHSSVLEWATTAAAVLAAVGLGAQRSLPVPVILAAMAAAAAAVGASRRAISWALVVGLGPLAAAAASLVSVGPGVMARLGLTGAEPRLAGALAGGVAAVVLGREASRRHSLVLVVAAAVTAAVGLADGWGSAVHRGLPDLIGAAALFLLLELAAWATTTDPFWSRPTRLGAIATEVLAGWAIGPLALVALARLSVHWTSATPAPWSGALLVAGGLSLAGWFVADVRRRQVDHTPLGIALLVGSGWLPTSLALAATSVAVVGAATASAPLVGVTAVVVAAFLVLGGRPGGAALAIVLTVPAAMSAPTHPLWCAGLGLAGALVLALATVVRAPLVRTDGDLQATWMLASSAILPVLGASLACLARVDVLGVDVGAIVALWAVALVLDNAEVGPGLTGVGLVPRAAAGLTLVTLPALHPSGVAVVTGLLAALALLDAIAWRRTWMAVVSAALVPITVAAAAVAAGVDRGWAALITMGLAVVATALDDVAVRAAGRSARWAGRVIAASAALVALGVAGPDRAVLATLLIAIGGLGVVWAVRLDELDLALVGALLIVGGTWLHLVDHHVRISEPYLAPVALTMVLAGWQARRRMEISSWVAYGPAVALLGGAAMVERVTGGGAGHALVAGAVGLAAVIVGGQRRLIAPLLLGTALLVVLAVHESLAVTAGVPTWGWLALGGVTLIGAGIAMERAQSTPLETGRRVVDVVAERFS